MEVTLLANLAFVVVIVGGLILRFGILPVLGGFVGRVLGNALYEETMYRAFLFALLVSQTAFTLVHVPGRFTADVEVENLPMFLAAPFVLGVLFALVYARTGNLFVTIGLHVLANDPVLLVDAGGIVLVPLLLVAPPSS